MVLLKNIPTDEMTKYIGPLLLLFVLTSCNAQNKMETLPITANKDSVRHGSVRHGNVQNDGVQDSTAKQDSTLLEKPSLLPVEIDSNLRKMTLLKHQVEQQQAMLDSINRELKISQRRYRNSKGELRFFKKNIDNLIKYNKCFGWKVDFLGKSYDAYIVDIDATNIKLFHKASDGKHYNFKSMSHEAQSNGTDLAFAMNAGMFRKNRNPLGLYIENGREKFKMNRVKSGYGNFYMQFKKNKPDFGLSNGVFMISQGKGAQIVFPDSLSRYDKKKITVATQSGPLMVKDGVFNEHFNRGSPNLNIRNGVGIINDKKVVFVISNEPVNFYEFSQLFSDFFHCKDALYLDGVISQIYAPELGVLQNTGHGFGPILGVIR